jgi:acyl-CoA hydrolase
MFVKMKSVQESETIYTELMIPSYANFGGKVHGGILLSIMDKVAYVCASKHSSSYVVTVAVEGVEFLSPVDVGDVVTVMASVNHVGKTSMIIGMRLESFNPRTGQLTHTNSCYFTMVAKNDDGSLKDVPGLLIQSESELRRFCEGKWLRENAKQKNKKLKGDLKEHKIAELIEFVKNERCKIQLTNNK